MRLTRRVMYLRLRVRADMSPHTVRSKGRFAPQLGGGDPAIEQTEYDSVAAR